MDPARDLMLGPPVRLGDHRPYRREREVALLRLDLPLNPSAFGVEEVEHRIRCSVRARSACRSPMKVSRWSLVSPIMFPI
ncbi:hypothetical protein D9V41_13590 [Aeromicrobium phragmitis]|uniref:Uncharacterized protein n=1 Tax=Aeromicrobium phragmitis TaxID=2478914 RepID=A0A3L8PK72_9ACTN|nr:hypothetical protein D9V41_13590 [Aeromicrobium phragmitis]